MTKAPGVPQQSTDYLLCGRSSWLIENCDRPRLWEGPACPVHITKEEEAVRATLRPTMQEMCVALYKGREEPACWSWVVPAILPVFADDEAANQYLNDWHEWQCAICGCLYPDQTDHDHSTGLERGMLCRSCNVREGKSDAPLIQNYRERNPASILGVAVRYWSPWSGYAEPKPEITPADRLAMRAAIEQRGIHLRDCLAGD